MKLHIAKEGDTLKRLAAVYGVSEQALREANPDLPAAEPLVRGLKVKIPFGPMKALFTSKKEAGAASGEKAAAAEESENVPPKQTAAEEKHKSDHEAKAKEQAAAPNDAAGSTEAKDAVQDEAMKDAPAPEETEKTEKKEVWTWSSFEKRGEASSAAGAQPQTDAQTQANAGQQTAQPSSPHQPEPAAALPNVTFQPQSASQPLSPVYYKTEWGKMNTSPLNVKWSGMSDMQTPYPFAAIPAPLLPAGAAASSIPLPPMPYAAENPPVNPLPYAAGGANISANEMPYAANAMPYGANVMPNVTPNAANVMPYAAGSLPGIDPSQMHLFGAYSPGYPPGGPAPGPIPALHGCGCGSPPIAPYAMPLKDEPAAKGKAGTKALEEKEAASGSNAEESQAGKKTARPNKKKARVSGAKDPLQELLKRAAAKTSRKPRRKSYPWINE